VAASSKVTVVSGATATSFRVNPTGDRVTEVGWRSVTGAGGRVRADTFVLAAGAIENARLLLLLRDQVGRPTLGGDWLGRGFMEHPVDRSLELRTRDEALARGPGFYACHDAPDGTPVMGRIAPLPGLLHERGLGNASIRLLLDDEPGVLRAAAPRALARRMVPGARARRVLGGAVRGAWGVVRRFRPVRYRLLVDLEQPPHRENRVLLASRRDALGVPRVTLHWCWRPEDEARRDRVVRLLAGALEASGSARVTRLEGTTLDPDAHHHSGTTRLHPDATEGVVDETLRVHDVENLHVAGSSVFPTSGFANPTLTAVALTLRLADHLAPERLR
jgi:choline dehydrogenase-like flavoprotein